MHVVRHQTERETGHACRCTRVAEQAQVQRAIGRGEEDLLPPVATLRDMMGQAGNDHAGKSSHRMGSARRERRRAAAGATIVQRSAELCVPFSVYCHRCRGRFRPIVCTVTGVQCAFSSDCVHCHRCLHRCPDCVQCHRCLHRCPDCVHCHRCPPDPMTGARVVPPIAADTHDAASILDP